VIDLFAGAPRATVLTTPVTAIGSEQAAEVVREWAAAPRGRALCAANVHMAMEAWDDPAFAAALATADLVVCDGRPLVWASRLLGVGGARQARGHDLMLAVCAEAERAGLRVGLYGGKPDVLDDLRVEVARRFPRLAIAYAWSPPFRELTAAEDDEVCAALGTAGVDVLFVSLGCPRQERWMLAHRERLSCTMLGVGAVFDMLTGRVGVAPAWAQRAGLEWLVRLAQEPRRLWRRYALHNARFVALVARQRLGRLARSSR